jgi:hypothetical protein
MKRVLALALIVLAFGACGRVGPPVRRQARPESAPPVAPVPVDEDDEEEY